MVVECKNIENQNTQIKMEMKIQKLRRQQHQKHQDRLTMNVHYTNHI